MKEKEERIFSCEIYDAFWKSDESVTLRFRSLEKKSERYCAHPEHKWHGWVLFSIEDERQASEECPVGTVFGGDQCQVCGKVYVNSFGCTPSFTVKTIRQ